MEVLHRLVQEEEAEVVEQLRTRRRQPHLADPKSDVKNGANALNDRYKRKKEVEKNGVSQKSVYYDKNEGYNPIAKEVDLPKLVNAVINVNQNRGKFKDEILSRLNQENIGKRENGRIDIVEESDEEVIELEFERAVEKVHTHTPYCLNCNSQITKVILRRRKKDSPRRDKPVDLFGCLSCFSIFIPSGKQESTEIVEDKLTSGGSATIKPGDQDTPDGDKEILKIPGRHPEITPPHPSLPSGAVVIDIGDETGGMKAPIKPESEITDEQSDQPPHNPEPDEEGLGKTTTDERGIIDTRVGKPAAISGSHDSKSLEILKCIVYGGLIVLITSLSIVSSAAASDASTLNVIAIGLATVFSGLMVFGHNLMDLKNDNSNPHTEKYQELLGRRGNFVLHASFAVLSYLVFGLIPPITYGFSFRESDNKDYKILAVAAASFACVFVLAIAKAYVRRSEKWSDYVKTIMYYVTMAISVSGVSYAAGDLIKMVMDKLGWFEPTQAANFIVSDQMTSATPAWASY